jgi:leucyl-tRNA synthetase
VRYERELNTMPQWAGSCWYYLRFLDPRNAERFVGETAERYWMLNRKKDAGKLPVPDMPGVDLYVGGAEHAVLHLLYARFWHKALFDLGHVSTPEPFGRLFNQGYIQAYAYTDARGVYVNADEVQQRETEFAEVKRLEKAKDGGFVEVAHRTNFWHGNTPVVQEYGKMGKSLKNAVSPDEMCEQHGADTLRLYEMYLGPLDQSKPWNTRDIVGPHRFLQRVWRNLVDEATGQTLVSDAAPPDELRRLLHKTIKRVTEAMNSMSFNVAIAALIELNNELVGTSGGLPREVAEAFVRMLAPMAPHIGEELWQKLGHTDSITRAPWPRYDAALLVESEIEYPVQVNGKVRGHVKVPADADDRRAQEIALSDERVKAFIEGKAVKKIVVVKRRMINIVVG